MPSMRRTSALVAAGLLAGLSACALRGPGRDTLLSSTPPQRDRACFVALDPERLPEAADLLDADAFAGGAARAWARAGKPSGYVLLSLRYDRYGLNVRRAVLEHTVPPELAEEVQRLAFAHKREMPRAAEEWGVRLRVDLGETPSLRVGRREECRPAPRDADMRNAAAGGGFDVRNSYYAANRSPGTLADPGLVWVRVRLNASGMVTDARVERALYRSGSWETRLLAVVRTLQFEPALEDGYPVPSETSIPMRIGAVR